GTGTPGDRFLDPDHPYAADLDLFGTGSLFERICTARTRAGEEVLASWLLTPTDRANVRRRNAAVDELRPDLDLREDLELLGVEVREGIDPDALAAWGREPPVFGSRTTGRVATGLASLAAVALVVWATTDVGYLPLAVVVLFEVLFVLSQRAR